MIRARRAILPPGAIDDDRGDQAVRRLLVFALLSLGAWPGAVLADIIEGRATVIDGDSIDVAGQRIRLHGIDAPEGGQSCERSGIVWLCGAVASARLRELVRDAEVRCEERDRDRYGRIVAVCQVGATDIGAAMVAAGLALAYRQYSSDYAGQEATAQAARAGMWSGSFVAPWEWRQGKRRTSAPANDNRAPAAGASSSPAACTIKGNVSKSGERIYHVPGGAFYDATVIDPGRGERWFCSEADAWAAGWRRSRR